MIGGQGVLGQSSRAPEALLASIEAEVFPRHAPDKFALIENRAQSAVLRDRLGAFPVSLDRIEAWQERLRHVEEASAIGRHEERTAWTIGGIGPARFVELPAPP